VVLDQGQDLVEARVDGVDLVGRAAAEQVVEPGQGRLVVGAVGIFGLRRRM